MNLQKVAIIKYYEKDNEWRDITEDVRFINDKVTFYEIVYSNGKSFPDKKRYIKYLKEPQEYNAENFVYFHNGVPLVDILKILKFDEWLRIFFMNGEVRSYPMCNVKYKEIANKETKVNNFLKYLYDITNYIEDETGILNSQLQSLTILKESIMYKIINNEKIDSFNIDSKKLIFPFSYNKSQREAVHQALNNRISLIQGPPGTGKTQTILNIIANLIYNGKNVAVVAGNNEATKNVKEKLASVNLDFLTAYIGKKENTTSFFNEKHAIPDECNIWKENKIDIKSLEQELAALAAEANAVMQYQVDVSRINQLIHELKIEKAVNDAEFIIAFASIPSNIKNRHFTLEKLLQLKAELEILPEKKLTNFFTQIRFLFKYGMFSRDKQFKNKNDIIDYLTNQYYELKLKALQKELDEKTSYLKQHKNFDSLEKTTSISNDLLHTKICELYMKDNNLTINNYKFYYNEFLKRFPIVFSTTHALAITSGHNHLYDYVIMDESSQIDLASATIALSCAKNVVLVGDLMQLPNVVKTNDKILLKTIFDKYSLPNHLEYINNSILKSIHLQYGNQIANTLLNEHYRCDPEIIGFCNKRFYDDKLIIRTIHKPGNGVEIRYTESHHKNKRKTS